MSNKNKNKDGIVYSTHSFNIESEVNENEVITKEPSKQNLLVRISTQGRAGKKATLVQRFEGSQIDLDKLARDIKIFCGSGGAVKQGEIVIQGDFAKKIVDYLISKNYRARLG